MADRRWLRCLSLLVPVCGMAGWLLAPRAAGDENWPQWRGPDANGVAPAGEYPTQWSATENIRWQYELPGLGASTPVIWEDRIFVTCNVDDKNVFLCVDRSGEEKWRIELGDGRAANNPKASGSNPSPVTDGQHVFVYFKSGDLACVDFEGEIVWQKNLQDLYGDDTLWWDLGTSPVLTADDVVIACMQSGDSYVAAFEKTTGEVSWKVARAPAARGESAQSYTTPVVISEGDSQTIVVLGADHVTAHDAQDGQQLWIAGGLNPRREQNWRSISSPVVSDGLVIAPYGRGSRLTAIRLGGSGDVTTSHVAWSIDGPAADVPTPVVSDGRIFICTDRGRVAMIDLSSGEVLGSLDLPRHRDAYSSSPVLAGGHLYVTNEDGTTYVIKVGDELEQVARNTIEDFTIATPVFCDGLLYLRTDRHLHCIGDGG